MCDIDYCEFWNLANPSANSPRTFYPISKSQKVSKSVAGDHQAPKADVRMAQLGSRRGLIATERNDCHLLIAFALFCVSASLAAAANPPTDAAIAVAAFNAHARLAEDTNRAAEARASHAALRATLLRASLPGEMQHELLMYAAYNMGNVFLGSVHRGAAAGNVHFDTRPAQIEAARSACREYAAAAAHFPAKAALFPRLHFSHGVALQQLQWATSRHRGSAARGRGITHAPEGGPQCPGAHVGHALPSGQKRSSGHGWAAPVSLPACGQ